MFRVQSSLEYIQDPAKQLFYVPEDTIYDLRSRHLARQSLQLHGSPFPDAAVLSGEPDPAIDFAQLAERFLIQAQLASENARSYRNFNIGAMVYAEISPGIVGVFHGANIKLDPHSPKICAERVALEKAREKECGRIIGVAVYGPTQQDHGSGMELPVLHPCEACRKMFQESPMASEDMLVASANPDGQYEFTDLHTVLAIHERGVEPDTIVDTHRVPASSAASIIQFTLAGWIPGHEKKEA